MSVVNTFNFEIFGKLESLTVILKNNQYALLDAFDQYVPGFAGFADLANLLTAVECCFEI